MFLIHFDIVTCWCFIQSVLFFTDWEATITHLLKKKLVNLLRSIFDLCFLFETEKHFSFIYIALSSFFEALQPFTAQILPEENIKQQEFYALLPVLFSSSST
mmetsp:Transcript_14118/g.24995  ORF Transcript_14118/g.24995 Transcript_14118/m.24995 type:complete len:102 (+) Transcript_14118:248-553(+)